MTEAIRKITAKTIGLTKGAKGAGETAVIYGRVTRWRASETDLGPYIEFGGQFEALNEQDGAIYSAGKAIMPGGLMENELTTAIQSAQQEDKAATVDFAVRFKKVEADNPMGCEWRAETLTDPGQSDPVAQLRQKLAPKVKALSAPNTDSNEADDNGNPKSSGKTA